MAEDKTYPLEEAKNIIIRYLKDKTKIREFSYIIGFLFRMSDISDDATFLTEKDISTIKEKVDKFGYYNIYRIDEDFKKTVEEKVKEAYEKDNRPNTIDIKIELKDSKWWTIRRVYSHLAKIGSMLNSKDISIKDVKTSFKNVTIFCEYAPKDSVEDLIEEYMLSHKSFNDYKEIASHVGCSIDRVKQVAPKVCKTYIM